MSAVLVIAGSDSSGGAGLTRDVETLARFGVGALCALTAVTVQSDQRLLAMHVVPGELVSAQIAAAFGSGRVAAVKIGMLGSRANVQAVAACLAQRTPPLPIVLDPVLSTSSGGTLLDTPGRGALLEELLPRVTLLTPNIPEAAALLELPEARDEEALISQARSLLARGPAAVLLKGGHAAGETACDYLLARGEPLRRLCAAREPRTRRGTGCALASAVAAGLACGRGLHEACVAAKEHVTELLQNVT